MKRQMKQPEEIQAKVDEHTQKSTKKASATSGTDIYR